MKPMIHMKPFISYHILMFLFFVVRMDLQHMCCNFILCPYDGTVAPITIRVIMILVNDITPSSVNNEHFAREMYRDAGASGFLSKSAHRGPEIIKSIVSQWHNTPWQDVLGN